MTAEEIGILAGVLSFVLALLIFTFDQADKKRGRRVLAGGVVLLMVGVAFALWTSATKRARASDVDNDPRPEIRPPGDRPSVDSAEALRDTAARPTPPQEQTEPPYSRWLRRDGALIRYNAAVYMPGSCPGRIMAVGDFGPGGWTSGPEARCDADGWLTFDAARLLEEPRFVAGQTYCLNFLDEHGRYGQHGAPPRAPGLSAIEVPAREGAGAGLTIGFRVTRLSGAAVVEFTKEGKPHCE
jgi:hypothetical protein